MINELYASKEAAFEAGKSAGMAGHRAMLKAMKRQRDGFLTDRDMIGALGSSHSDEARKCMAALLDWFIVEYGDKK